MYSLEKSLREEKSRKHPKNPSFSSSLLDEIYRSIDGSDEKGEDLKLYSAKKYSSSSSTGVRIKTNSREDVEMASIKRAGFVEKWMEKKIHDKVSSLRGPPPSLPELENESLHDNDPLFSSSTSSSSDSSTGGLSSSDTEFFASAKSRKSCFAAPWPKPVRTSVSPRLGHHKKEFHKLDEYQNQQTTKEEDSLIKSKSRALKIYANLKKMKQPISPGGRLASFINSIFTNGNAKKGKTSSTEGGYEHANTEMKSNSTLASTCSSASSFSRSCLSKCPPNSRGKMTDGEKRTVRFYPVSVIVDEDCRPCGHKSIYDEDSNKFGRLPLPQNVNEPKHHLMLNNRKIQGFARETFKSYQDQKKIDCIVDRTLYHDEEDDDDDDDDAASDSSSDLFEIDHLALFRNNRFCEELPVYETTHLDTNLAIASGLIR